jgi:hypothetical protein
MCRQDQRLAGPCRLERLVYPVELCKLERKVGQTMQTIANGLVRTMQTKVEGWPGHAD